MTVYANDTPSNKSNPEKNAASVDHLNETSVPYIVPDKPITPELLAAVPGGVKASELFEDAAPILALNLPDWRATEKKLVRRLDMTLLPLLWLLYWNNYLDRTNLVRTMGSSCSCCSAGQGEENHERYCLTP